ncbi:MAG: type IV secretion system DNA-binding domain-containing protein [Patescibacteria group bacterium]
MDNYFNPHDIAVFAETNFRNQRRRFGIKTDDRRRHMYLIGKTGMGKSTVIENMVIDDIRNGRGVAVVDPHGDLVEKIIKFIPPERINDVIYFNPADTAHPIAFNILENIDPEYKHLIAYGLVGVFKKIWADSWGPRMEYILTNTILALLEYPGSTLLGIMRMLVDKKYRKKVVSNITDPVVRTFWTDEYANYSEKFRTEAIAPIQNKVGQFLASSIIRNIVGQSKSTIEMRSAIDQGKIILMNLSKGRIGEENSALLGAMMITKIQLAAMSRVDIPESERRDFYLYVDEFQNFSTDSFANILSEARKYRLNLIMAHQYIEQLNDEVKAAVFGNVGTIICFRIGATDAALLEPEFEPKFVAQNLVNIPKYNFYLKLMIDGVSSDPFSAMGLPPYNDFEDNAEKVIAVSRERYARPKKIVEDRILKWSGVDIPKREEEPVVLQKKEPVREESAIIESQIHNDELSYSNYSGNDIESYSEQPYTEIGDENNNQVEVQFAPEEQENGLTTPRVNAMNDFSDMSSIANVNSNNNSVDGEIKKKKRKRKKKKKNQANILTPASLPVNAVPIVLSDNNEEEISLEQMQNKTVSFIKPKQNITQNTTQIAPLPNFIHQNNQTSSQDEPVDVQKSQDDDSDENKISLNDLFNN